MNLSCQLINFCILVYFGDPDISTYFIGLKSNRVIDYEVRGTNASKMFNAFCAISAMVTSNTAGIIPEIQVNTLPRANWSLREPLLNSQTTLFQETIAFAKKKQINKNKQTIHFTEIGDLGVNEWGIMVCPK